MKPRNKKKTEYSFRMRQQKHKMCCFDSYLCPCVDAHLDRVSLHAHKHRRRCRLNYVEYQDDELCECTYVHFERVYAF